MRMAVIGSNYRFLESDGRAVTSSLCRVEFMGERWGGDENRGGFRG